ncbi:MAG: deoxyribonuclease IV [Solirubrobacterales bacterium]|nr:deoxyribonuclease IV [Solirubrobacterales bacterium]
MLIGAHVSTAGGLDKTVGRGVERECDAIQIFHQSPRMWRPTNYTDRDFAGFRTALAASPIESVVIHAVYLVNCASKERDTRSKSIASLSHALRVGDAIGAGGVVLHAGARKGEPHGASMRRAAKAIARALASSEECPVLLENTAGTQGPLGRNFDELADLIDLLDGDRRVGVCIDCCHLLASGYEIRDPEALSAVVDELDAKVGLRRLRCLHVNDSKIPLGGNRDHHANLGEGELGDRGLATFLSEPRFAELPALIETPGPDGHGPDLAEVKTAKRLRKRGIAARKRRGRRSKRTASRR